MVWELQFLAQERNYLRFRPSRITEANATNELPVPRKWYPYHCPIVLVTIPFMLPEDFPECGVTWSHFMINLTIRSIFHAVAFKCYKCKEDGGVFTKFFCWFRVTMDAIDNIDWDGGYTSHVYGDDYCI